MENLALKMKLSVLWLFYVGAFLTVMALGIMAPGTMNSRDKNNRRAREGAKLFRKRK